MSVRKEDGHIDVYHVITGHKVINLERLYERWAQIKEVMLSQWVVLHS